MLTPDMTVENWSRWWRSNTLGLRAFHSWHVMYYMLQKMDVLIRIMLSNTPVSALIFLTCRCGHDGVHCWMKVFPLWNVYFELKLSCCDSCNFLSSVTSPVRITLGQDQFIPLSPPRMDETVCNIVPVSCSSEGGKQACVEAGGSCVAWLDGYNVQVRASFGLWNIYLLSPLPWILCF